MTTISQIDTFDKNTFSAPTRNGDTITHNVYSRGSGPVVVIIQELPGIGQETLALADKFVNDGYKVFLPHLFGPLGKTSGLPNFIRVFCMRKEFAIFEKNKSSPIVDWLKALCQEIRKTESVEGVGVIGMCLTGNFAISLMADDSVLAGVASQPALPLKGPNLLHMSEEEVASTKARLSKVGPMKAYRFEEDHMCKQEKFETIDKIFNSGDTNCVDLKVLPGKGHSVLTLHFVDEDGHPTKNALNEILDYFKSKLHTSTKSASTAEA
jgi:dienelactone hydrolase